MEGMDATVSARDCKGRSVLIHADSSSLRADSAFFAMKFQSSNDATVHNISVDSLGLVFGICNDPGKYHKVTSPIKPKEATAALEVAESLEFTKTRKHLLRLLDLCSSERQKYFIFIPNP